MREQLIDYMNQLLLQMVTLDKKGKALAPDAPLPPAFLQDLNQTLRDFYALWPFWKEEAQRVGAPAEDINGLLAAVEELKSTLPVEQTRLNWARPSPGSRPLPFPPELDWPGWILIFCLEKVSPCCSAFSLVSQGGLKWKTAKLNYVPCG